MTKTPKEIKIIYNFLKKCKYENISNKNLIDYKSPLQIEQTKSCVCFDGAMYALSKIKQLPNQKSYKPKILTIKGIKKEDNVLKNVAHSVCIYNYKGKIGAIGKSGTESMQFKEPVYDNLLQLGLDFSYDFFQREILIQNYFIEDEKNFDILILESSKNKFHTQNEICYSKYTIPNYIEQKSIKQYLLQKYNVNNEKFDKFIKRLKSR